VRLSIVSAKRKKFHGEHRLVSKGKAAPNQLSWSGYQECSISSIAKILTMSDVCVRIRKIAFSPGSDTVSIPAHKNARPCLKTLAGNFSSYYLRYRDRRSSE